jgi:outer membrane protein TolC
MKRDLAISQLDYEKAIVQYRQTLYQAFADVENACLHVLSSVNKYNCNSGI